MGFSWQTHPSERWVSEVLELVDGRGGVLDLLDEEAGDLGLPKGPSKRQRCKIVSFFEGALFEVVCDGKSKGNHSCEGGWGRPSKNDTQLGGKAGLGWENREGPSFRGIRFSGVLAGEGK